MTNPARELHSVYGQWREIAVNADRAMPSIVDPTSNDGASQIINVARLLARIDDILTSMEKDGRNVGVYRRQYPDWTLGMLSYRAGWNGNVHPDHIMTEGHMDEIEAFANFLDGKVIVFAPEQENRLRAILDRARKALEEDETLDAPLREYIHRLLQSIQNALDDAAVGGGFDMAEAVQALWVALRAAESASKANKTVWRDIWTQILAGSVSGALVEAGVITIAAIAG